MPHVYTLTMIAIALLLAAQESGLGPVAAINATGFKMLAQAAEVSENAVLSPLGVHMALAACWIGSDGTARTGLGTALSMPPGPGAEIADQYGALLRTLRTQGDALGVASAIWLPAPPHADLAKLLERAFDARTYKLPESEAEIARAVNEWASSATGSRIKRLLDRPRSGTRFVVASASTFDAEWPSKMLLGVGRAGMEFHIGPGKTKLTESLSTKRENLHTETESFEAVVVSYRQASYGLLLVEPKGDRTLEALLGEVDEAWLASLRKGLRSRLVQLTFPKFAVRSTLAVPAFLKNMGAGDALTPGNRFPGFGVNLFLQEVLHSAAVEVDEVGTRAASGTAVRGGAIGRPSDEVSFVVDRPFLFGILDQRSGLLVFSGICRRP